MGKKAELVSYVFTIDSPRRWSLKTHQLKGRRVWETVPGMTAMEDRMTHFLFEVKADRPPTRIAEEIASVFFEAKKRGEHIEEVFHEWGPHPYSYKYHPGEDDD